MAILGDGKARQWVTADFSCVMLGTNTVNQERADFCSQEAVCKWDSCCWIMREELGLPWSLH